MSLHISQQSHQPSLREALSLPSDLIKKFLPLGIMLFFMAFNHVILRDMKDTIIINNSEVSQISILKLYFVKPTLILFGVFYIFLCQFLNREKIFYAILTPFLIFFGACGLFISPNPDFLQKEIVGLFYLAADLWGPIILTLLFWNFANEIMSVKEARKSYVLLGVFLELGLILGSLVLINIMQKMTEGTSFNFLMGLVTLSGIIIIALYYWINRAIKTDPLICNSMSEILSEQRSLSSLMNNIVYVLKSPYLWLIIIIIFSHDLLTNLLGIIWRGQVGAQFVDDKSAYNQFMGNSAVISGAIGLFFTIPAYIILARFRWIVSALLTPILILITGLIFLGLVYIQGSDPTLPFIGTTNLWINRFLVNLPNYSGLFMVTLVIAFIPLDQILKNQGRAMVVIMFAPIIKSLITFVSSQIQMITLTKGVPVHISRIPLTLILLIVVVTFWILCVKSLSTRFEALNDVKQG